MALTVALGWPFVKRLGIEVDEALIAAGIYERAAPWYSWRIAGGELPIMMLTYLGALKTWMYNAVFAIWAPGQVSLRLPTLLIAAAALPLFFVLVNRILDRRSAWIATALLAADPAYVMNGAIDFGPVALQHAFKIGALLLLVEYHRRPSAAKLAGGFFLFGVALWDKAVFVWVLVGLACASLVIWREVRPHLTGRNFAIAAGAFLVGAAPLIVYNIQRPLETFTTTVRLAPDNPHIKLLLLARTLNGSAAFGYFTAPDLGPHPGVPTTWLGQASFAIARATGEPWSSLLGWATLAAILATPLLSGTRAFRPAVFSIVAMAAIWIQMFFTNGAGGAMHHVILLWPFHLVVIAAVLTRVPARPAVAMAALLAASELLALNSYYVNLTRNGAGARWTDASNGLHRFLSQTKAPLIVTADWGILETQILLSEGGLPIEDASAPLRAAERPEYREQLARLVTAEGALFIAHGEAYEQAAGSRAKLNAFAAALGYAPQPVQTIQDRNGRPVFEIFRYRR